MITGIRRRETFAVLRQRGQRARRQGVLVVHASDDSEMIEVAFAIPRQAATAVRRNRCRRRLRASFVALDRAGRVPAGAYLVSIRGDAVLADQHTLQERLAGAISSLASSPLACNGS